VEVSPDLISTVTDGIVAEVTTWQGRPLERPYPVVFFDALRVKIHDEAHRPEQSDHRPNGRRFPQSGAIVTQAEATVRRRIVLDRHLGQEFSDLLALVLLRDPPTLSCAQRGSRLGRWWHGPGCRTPSCGASSERSANLTLPHSRPRCRWFGCASAGHRTNRVACGCTL
jgi:hypothetical protein